MPKLSLPELRQLDLESEIAQLYSTELAYHNFQHVLDTLEAATDILAKCSEEGIRVDAEVVYFALLFHDAGFRDNHIGLGFDTKEAYAADLATMWLRKRGHATQLIDKVVGAIGSTHRDAAFVTSEQKVVRAADLSGLAADYSIFLRNAENLKIEYELFNNCAVDWPAWVDNVRETVQFYLSQEIRLTSYFSAADGESAYHRAVRDNLERLIAEA